MSPGLNNRSSPARSDSGFGFFVLGFVVVVVFVGGGVVFLKSDFVCFLSRKEPASGAGTPAAPHRACGTGQGKQKSSSPRLLSFPVQSLRNFPKFQAGQGCGIEGARPPLCLLVSPPAAV